MRGPVRFLCRNEIGMRLKINKSPVSGRGSCGARVAGDFFVGGGEMCAARGAQRRQRPAGRRRAEPPGSPALRATAALRF